MDLLTLLAQSDGGGGNTLYSLILFGGMGLIFYFILLRPQMKQQKEHQNLINNLKKGDKVITNGGLWGEVDEVETQTIRLRLNDKTRIRVSRSAVSAFQPDPNAKKN